MVAAPYPLPSYAQTYGFRQGPSCRLGSFFISIEFINFGAPRKVPESASKPRPHFVGLFYREHAVREIGQKDWSRLNVILFFMLGDGGVFG